MLNAVHDHDSGRVVDAVDDPVVASSRREKAGEFSDEFFAEPLGVLPDRAVYGSERCISNLRRETVEMAEPFGGDA